MRVPKSVREYVSNLNDVDARDQLARLLAKSLKHQRVNDDVTTVTISGVVWNPRARQRCTRCAQLTHSYSTASVSDGSASWELFYCNDCHKQQWSWL